MNHPMNNFMQHQNIRESGLPTGRRYHGYGISPAGPGGPHPAHQMNFMGPMANLGMSQHPFGAGRYPFPHHPMPFQGVGGGHGGMPPFTGGPAGPGLPGMNPMAAQMASGGMMNPMAAMGGMNGMNGMSSMNPMNPMMTYMSPQLLELLGGGMNLYDDDDTGVWDGDDEDADGIIQPRRGNRRMRRRRAGLPPFGPGMGMNPMGMAGMPGMGMPGMPMGMPMGMPLM